jgi:hypothetical protein
LGLKHVLRGDRLFSGWKVNITWPHFIRTLVGIRTVDTLGDRALPTRPPARFCPSTSTNSRPQLTRQEILPQADLLLISFTTEQQEQHNPQRWVRKECKSTLNRHNLQYSASNPNCHDFRGGHSFPAVATVSSMRSHDS